MAKENPHVRENIFEQNKKRQQEIIERANIKMFENWIRIGSLKRIIIYPIDGGIGYDEINTYFSKFGISNSEHKNAHIDRNLVLYSFKNKQAKIRNRIDLEKFDDYNLYKVIQEKLINNPENLRNVKIKYLDENDTNVKDLSTDIPKRFPDLFKSDVDLRIGLRDRKERCTFNKTTRERLTSMPAPESADILNAYSQYFSTFSLVSEKHLSKLKSICPRSDISYKNFRPNLVLGDRASLDYKEEDIIQIKIKRKVRNKNKDRDGDGDEDAAIFPIIHPWTHRRIVNNPSNAKFPDEPYNTLMKHRNYSAIYPGQAYNPNAPVFGINMEMGPEEDDTKYKIFKGYQVYAKFKQGATIQLGSRIGIVGAQR